MDERGELIRQAEALRDQRASITNQLKDIAAEIWRGSDQKSVMEIRRRTGLSRTTLYAALRERGIEPTSRP